MIDIRNGDCLEIMHSYEDNLIDVVLTSPPYNTTNRSVKDESNRSKQMKNYTCRYDVYVDNKTTDEYVEWSRELFNEFDRILKPNGVILYNISYGNERPSDMWLVIADIIKNTNFMVADCITWKKACALPQNVSPNKLTRICEFVFVICRKDEYGTYMCNKKVTSVRDNGMKMYGVIYNFVEAKNNDGSNDLNKATYSTELCEKLLGMYANKGAVVYDPFMGTGTTAMACQNLGLDCYGSELSPEQVKFALDRLNGVERQNITIGEENATLIKTSLF